MRHIIHMTPIKEKKTGHTGVHMESYQSGDWGRKIAEIRGQPRLYSKIKTRLTFIRRPCVRKKINYLKPWRGRCWSYSSLRTRWNPKHTSQSLFPPHRDSRDQSKNLVIKAFKEQVLEKNISEELYNLSLMSLWFTYVEIKITIDIWYKYKR